MRRLTKVAGLGVAWDRPLGDAAWSPSLRPGAFIGAVTDLGSNLVCNRCPTRYAGVFRVGFCFLPKEIDLLHVTRGLNGQNIVHGWWCFGIWG